MSTIKIASRDDILRWPDGTTCYRWEWERGDYAYMSDDFEVITEDSPEYEVVQASGVPHAPALTAEAPPAGFVPDRLAACPCDSLDTSEREAIDP